MVILVEIGGQGLLPVLCQYRCQCFQGAAARNINISNMYLNYVWPLFLEDFTGQGQEVDE
jgi:hypothetical protein